jgi:DNA modification methylase
MNNKIKIADRELSVEYVPVASLRSAEYNPRTWTKEATEQLTESIKRFGIVDPLLCNAAPQRKGTVIGGNFRMSVFRQFGIKTCPVVWVNIPDVEKEKELCVRLNKNTGAFDWDLLAGFGENFLADIGFTSEELDDVFDIDETPEVFDLQKELKKLQIDEVRVRKGDVYRLGTHRVMCGDSTVEKEVLKLMNSEKADLCLTDPPYILSYLTGKKRHGKATEGFGLKRDRKYLETDSLPPDFTEKWMAAVAKVQKPDFSIMVFENPKNLRTIWNALEKYWKYRNTIVWRLPNRMQGFSSKYKFFNKHDIALLGTGGNVSLNTEPETDPLLESEYENALFATSGKPHWEPYKKGNKHCPTDYIEYIAADEKSSGQGIIFGTKPVEILLPYLKVLTKRGDIVLEPFGGSGSTLITAERMRRRCRLMEKSPVYTEVIKRRWEKLTGQKAQLIAHGK